MGAAVCAVVQPSAQAQRAEIRDVGTAHAGQVDAILRRREHVYEAAKQRCPERWSGATRNWQLKDEVWLNPERADPALFKLAA